MRFEVLKKFLTPYSVPALAAEADGVVGQGCRSFSRTNAYFTIDDPDLPESHPIRRFFE